MFVKKPIEQHQVSIKSPSWHSSRKCVLTVIGGQTESTTTVVFFLGGCTYTEIAALRWMSKQTKGRRFLIATTGIINGNTVSQYLNIAHWREAHDIIAARESGRCTARCSEPQQITHTTSRATTGHSCVIRICLCMSVCKIG